LLARLPSPRKKRRSDNIAALNKVVYKLIDDHRASPTDKGDLLSILLATLDEEGDGQGMSNEQVRDEVMTLFLAGHETTANALSWAFYALTQNPDVEARLHAELDGVLGGRTPVLADLPNLPYTRQVFSEAMRLYPPAWIMGRTAIGPDEIGGYTIPAGATIIFSQYLMHRNPAYWPNPDCFDPERFAPGHEADRPRYAYFPFGGGPRLCIGEPFAWMEGQLLLASLAQNWRFRLAPGAVIEPEPSITLRLKHGLPVILHRA
jgi:cytochrome P450